MKLSREAKWKSIRTCGLIVVDVDSLQLEVRVTMVGTGGVNTVLVRDYLPKLEKKKEFKFISWLSL